MIIWGGFTSGGVTNTGASYNPATDTWAAVTTVGAPAARHSHGVVWTGTKMIVWGGYGTNGYEPAGGIYDPVTDKWTAMETSGQAAPRKAHAMWYDGTDIIIWGGCNGNNCTALNSGARYNIAGNSWSSMNLAGAPSPRYRMAQGFDKPTPAHPKGIGFVWGGTDGLDWFGDGAFYDPSTNAWTKIGMSCGYPPTKKLEGTVALNRGNIYGFYVYGGWDGFDFYNDVLRMWHNQPPYPKDGCWVIETSVSAPKGRSAFNSAAPGNGIFVWGGCNGAGCSTQLADGASWRNKGNGTWTGCPPGGLSARSDATAVWTGSEVLVWGGYDGKAVGTGARRALDPT
jgi:hypothetical protein